MQRLHCITCSLVSSLVAPGLLRLQYSPPAVICHEAHCQTHKPALRRPAIRSDLATGTCRAGGYRRLGRVQYNSPRLSCWLVLTRRQGRVKTTYATLAAENRNRWLVPAKGKRILCLDMALQGRAGVQRSSPAMSIGMQWRWQPGDRQLAAHFSAARHLWRNNNRWAVRAKRRLGNYASMQCTLLLPRGLCASLYCRSKVLVHSPP